MALSEQDGAFHPGRQVGGVFSRKHEPAIDLTEVVIVLLPQLVVPARRAAERKGNAMPGDGNPVLEFRLVLWMQF